MDIYQAWNFICFVVCKRRVSMRITGKSVNRYRMNIVDTDNTIDQLEYRVTVTFM